MSTENTYINQSQATKSSTCCASEKQSRLLPWLPKNRVLLIAAAIAAIGGGFALNWGWLVAAGLAPIIVSLLPCVVMCALGIGICKMAGNKAANPGPQPDGSSAEKAADPAAATTHAGERNAS